MIYSLNWNEYLKVKYDELIIIPREPDKVATYLQHESRKLGVWELNIVYTSKILAYEREDALMCPPLWSHIISI